MELSDIYHKASDLLDKANESEHEFILAFATVLYDKGICSSGQAASFAEIPKADFIRQMGKYKISAFGETAEDILAL